MCFIVPRSNEILKNYWHLQTYIKTWRRVVTMQLGYINYFENAKSLFNSWRTIEQASDPRLAIRDSSDSECVHKLSATFIVPTHPIGQLPSIHLPRDQETLFIFFCNSLFHLIDFWYHHNNYIHVLILFCFCFNDRRLRLNEFPIVTVQQPFIKIL